MKTFLHTIALEPARWTPLRVARPLCELLPAIAKAGFRELEVFEPHLALAANEAALPGVFASLGLTPVILSSYLNVNPSVTSDSVFEDGIREMESRVNRFGFRKVRLFPGPGVNPSDEPAVTAVARRIAKLGERLPDVEFLLESHDGSIADLPSRLVKLVRDLASPNVGILFQPTIFAREPALRQVEEQWPWIKHMHLQNRSKDAGHFVRLGQGAVPWAEIVATIKAGGREIPTASLEFVPSAICSVEEFDLNQSLAEAADETHYAESI